MPRRRPAAAAPAEPASTPLAQQEGAADLVRHDAREQAEIWLDTMSALEDQLDRYVQLFQDAPIAYVALDLRGRILHANRAAATLFRLLPHRLTGKSLLTFLARTEAKAYARHLMQSAKGFASGTLQLREPEGATRPVRLSSRASIFRGEPMLFTVIADVSAELRDQSALRISERRHREIVETASEGICIVDANNQIVFANHRLAGMVGMTLIDLIGRSFLDVVPEVDRAAAAQAFEQRDTGRYGQSEVSLGRTDGSVLATNVSSTIMRDDQGRFTGMLRMFTDATARVALAAARQEYVRRVLDAQEQERRRIARELHDRLGQHLVAFSLGLARLATETTGNADAAATLEQLRAVSQLLGRDMHTLALELRPAALDHLGLGPAIVSYVEDVGKRTDIDFDVHCDAGGETAIDPPVESAIYRITQEAISNIIKHAKATRVSVILERRGPELQLIVEDNGIGFVPQNVSSGKLGLLGMRERAELVGGSLLIESTPGTGTTIFVRVPLSESTRHGQETSATAR